MPLFSGSDANHPLIQQNTKDEMIHRSIFIDARYDAVISFIREVDKLKPELREKELTYAVKSVDMDLGDFSYAA